MDEKLQQHLGEVARSARLRLGLTQAEVAQQVRLKPAVYGRIERGKMTPSVPSLRRICTVLGLSSDLLLSLAPREKESAIKRAPEPVEHPELSRIIHLVRDWSPERLLLARKLLETVHSHFPK